MTPRAQAPLAGAVMRLVFRLAVGCWLLLVVGCAARGAGRAPLRDQALSGAQLHRHGVQLAQAGDLTRAEQYLSAALRSGHQPVQTLQALLATCVRAGRLRSALSYAQPQLAAQPQQRELRLLVAALYFALQDLARAEQELRTVLAQQETSAEGHFLLALLLTDRGHQPEQEEARHHFLRYLQLAPQGRHADQARAALERWPIERAALRRRRG